ncbi:AAA family ATPase [Nonomuraea rhodomycinica]|uniref:AAA family ATPase n=1 Tax=Nonomuraea rhodomycinica TaxID=1712872 RepID=A0A7Y6IUF3_9ACTN|nr:AAA family ATPase [Nonomuraea rhodomycinica]NUW43299.1 AAA family ATPase [Nonomuraea rhodomycinica]
MAEEDADKHIGQARTWVQDGRNQLALLDSFFSALRPGSSLALIYAKDIPLLEQRVPGSRILIGAGMVTHVGNHVPWEKSRPGPLDPVMWERSVSHSIRAPSFSDGFLLPYQQLMANPDLVGEDLTPFIARTAPELFNEFSYVSELVSHDSALAALVEIARVVERLTGVANGPWDVVTSWISQRMADIWIHRGAYPGLGSALLAAGIPTGALIAHRVFASDPNAEANPWAALEKAMSEAAQGRGAARGLAQRMVQKIWKGLLADPERFELLRLLARFSLTADQSKRIFDREARKRSGITVTDSELLENPYRIYELDRGSKDSISLHSIDRGLFPRDAGAAAVLLRSPLPDPVEEAIDDRRIRAACVSILERAAEDGHTLLDGSGLRDRLGAMSLEPVCDPTSDAFRIVADEFAPVLRSTALAGNKGQGWQLERLAAASDLITDEVLHRVEAGPIDVTGDWRALIDAVIKGAAHPDDADEHEARQEKARALETLMRSRISVLVGPAGTGKTTMLQALCSHPTVSGRVLLLAPTGKARVQLGEKAGSRARTLAQYLRPFNRWNAQTNTYDIHPNGRKDNNAYTAVIVDEASMLPEEALAALIATLGHVDRLVLCGDHRQLPPIGAGRPFADLVQYLRDSEGAENGNETALSGGGLAELTVARRQKDENAPHGSQGGRDDLAVASWFSVDGSQVAADEAMARVLAGEGDGTLEIRRWTTETDLHKSIVECLVGMPELSLEDKNAYALCRSFGAVIEERFPRFPDGGRGAENWQLLSPVRAQQGGIVGLNRLIRRVWREGGQRRARSNNNLPKPMGADQILLFDKVMIGYNRTHDDVARTGVRERIKGDLANGEIGLVVNSAGRVGQKPTGIKVELATQEDLVFTFWEGLLNGEDKDLGREILELAYAITVHKSQGSQFKTTFVIIPNPCPLLSPELLYTALTRHRGRCVLFIQGDPAELRRVAGPLQSDTGRRLTRLFHAPDPFKAPNGRTLDGAHIHLTVRGELVTSKSEVIVANILANLDVPYVYEQPLVMADASRRLPDFTVSRAGRPPIYWEHLGMLDKSSYRANWEAKRRWYADHGIKPWTDGGGPEGTLVWSTEGVGLEGINAQEIEALARQVFEIPPSN